MTGSDQTGASIYGFREDKRYNTPNDGWTDGERQLHEYLQKSNPEEAEAYAIRTNDRHNQRKKNEKLKNVESWMEQSGWHGTAAWMGARGAELVNGMDGYNQQIELAATGRVAPSHDVSLSDFAGTVDDTNAKNISDRFGSAAGLAYSIGTDVADAMISRGANYLPIAKLPSKKEIRLHDVNEAIDAFNRGYLGSINQGVGTGSLVVNGLISAVGNVGVGIGTETATKKLLKEGWLQKTVEEAVNSVAVGSVEWFAQNKKEIEDRTRYYMENKGKSQRTAKWMATKELFEESMK